MIFNYPEYYSKVIISKQTFHICLLMRTCIVIKRLKTHPINKIFFQKPTKMKSKFFILGSNRFELLLLHFVAFGLNFKFPPPSVTCRIFSKHSKALLNKTYPC